MSPSASVLTADEYSCPSEYTFNVEKKMCMKGNESKNPDCKDGSMMWDISVGKCVSKPTTTSSPTTTGPSGGTSPGAMAARNELMNSLSLPPPTTEGFTPYNKQASGGDFAPA